MTSHLDTLYQSSPVFFQQIGTALYGWWWYRKRYNRWFQSLAQELRSHEPWTAEQFNAYQEEHLKDILHQAQKSPFYREQYSGIDLETISLASLSTLPLLTKESLRTRPDELLTEPPARDVMCFKSSGTTGTPVVIYYPPRFHALEVALPEARNFNRAGLSYRNRRVMFGVRKVCGFDQNKPPFWRYSPAENMAYASIYHLSPANLPAYVKFLNQYRPEMITGYPSALSTIARYCLEQGAHLHPARGIFPMSEKLSADARGDLEAAWGCKVYDRYGAVEGCMYTSECEHGHMHVSPEAGIIEILDAHGNPCPPGVCGEVVCTGLQNTLQPLIRYRIGDVASWALDQTCPCGRHMPIIENIEGRWEDMCITADGRQMLRFDTVFKGIDHLLEAQVVQDSIEHFTVRVLPAEGFGPHEMDKMRENFRLHAGDCALDFEIVTQSLRSPSGKFRAVICRIPEEQKRRILQQSRSI